MSTEPTPAALTDQQIVERLATEVMGWKSKTDYPKAHRCPLSKGRRCLICDDWAKRQKWNPLTDWNHWRQVDEKTMSNNELWQRIEEYFNWNEEGYAGMHGYVEAPLATKCKALLSALDSLSANAD